MAGPAVDTLVLSFQLKIRLVMIKITDRLYRSKCKLGMALRTVLPEFVRMGVFMAVGAIVMLHPFEHLESRGAK